MSKELTAEDFRESLQAHVAAKGEELRSKYGSRIGWPELQRILQDRSCVRYPCEIVFDATVLQPGEFAHPVAKGDRPEAGFTIFVHPFVMMRLDRVPYLVLYQLVQANYGDFACADDAETSGASVLGLSKDDYYHALCEMVDEIAGDREW